MMFAVPSPSVSSLSRSESPRSSVANLVVHQPPSDDELPMQAAAPVTQVAGRRLGLMAGARTSVQVGALIGASVGVGMAAKAGYIAGMRAAPHMVNVVVSPLLLAAGAVQAFHGAGVVLQGVQGLIPALGALSERTVTTVKALGTAAHLCSMLGSAMPALMDPDDEPAAAFMLANAAGLVLMLLVVEMTSAKLLSGAVVPTRRFIDGHPIEPGSAAHRRVHRAGTAGLVIGQLTVHVALLWQVMSQVPRIQQALGAPADFQPGVSTARDHLLAGLGLASAVAVTEGSRVVGGLFGEAVGEHLSGAHRRAVVPGPEAAAVAEPQDVRTLSCLQRCARFIDKAARRIGLDDAARARAFGYAPILNLTGATLTTGAGSGFVTGLADRLNQPVAATVTGVANFTNALLNLIDFAVHLRPTRPGPSVPAVGSEPEPLQVTIHIPRARPA